MGCYIPVCWAFVLVLLSVCSSKRVNVDDEEDVSLFNTQRPHWRKGGRKKPNIILILTDDQDVELGSMEFMPKTLSILREGGVEFRHAYSSTPMCCPSRSSLLTGLYVHNHHVFTNNDNCSSPHWQNTHETRTFATYLSNAGYRTGYFGKYLNKYNGSYIPSGWREWAGLVMNSRFYNYSININGNRIKHGFDYHQDYYPDLIANDSVAFLRRSKLYFSKKPVMMVLSFPSPHGPEDAAPQYSNMFFNVTKHHTPSYDYAPNLDKQWILRVTDRMEPIHRKFTDLLMTKRLQTLQSVDDAVQKIYDELESLGELNNTFIFYTSDHGYHLGQFGLVKGKAMPYEFDVRVPLLVRGPGIIPGTLVHDMAVNIDLAPTFLSIAGVDPPSHMDGRSLLPLLQSGSNGVSSTDDVPWRNTVLIESSGRREGSIKWRDYAMMEKMKSPSIQRRLSKWEKMALQCRNKQYRSPCVTHQKWECIFEAGRWHMRRCKWSSRLSFQKKCYCLPYSTERQKQRAFLKEHIANDIRNYKPKFIKGMRSKRAAEKEVHDALQQFTANFQNSSWLDCSNCSSQEWREAKTYVNRQIRVLHGLLHQLRDIRRQLRERRPSTVEENRLNYTSQEEESEEDFDSSTSAHTQPVSMLTTESVLMSQSSSQTTPSTSGRIDVVILQPKLETQTECTCPERVSDRLLLEAEKALRQTTRLRIKEERQRRKDRKIRRKGKVWEEQCDLEKMNCFSHDNTHWRTPPLWTDGPFCVCMNANNNTYWCLRTVNASHNFLYCEFITGFAAYFDMKTDPFQLHNIVSSLSDDLRASLHGSLEKLHNCRGKRQCTITQTPSADRKLSDDSTMTNQWPLLDNKNSDKQQMKKLL